METKTPIEDAETPAVQTFYILRMEPFQMFGATPADPSTLPTIPVCVGMLDIAPAESWTEHRKAIRAFFDQNPDAPGGSYLTLKCPDTDSHTWGWIIQGHTASHTVDID